MTTYFMAPRIHCSWGGQKTLKFFDFSVFMRRGGAVSDQRPMHTSMAASYA